MPARKLKMRPYIIASIRSHAELYSVVQGSGGRITDPKVDGSSCIGPGREFNGCLGFVENVVQLVAEFPCATSARNALLYRAAIEQWLSHKWCRRLDIKVGDMVLSIEGSAEIEEVKSTLDDATQNEPVRSESSNWASPLE